MSKRMRVFLPLVLSLAVLVSCGAPLIFQPPPTSTPVPTPTPLPTPTPTPVPPQTVTFKVLAGEGYEFSYPLIEGDRVEYRIEADLDLDFYVLDPLGYTLEYWERVEQVGQSYFIAELTGVHHLVFDNYFSAVTSKTVTLTYRVVPEGGN